MADISKIKIPSGAEYNIKDNNAVTNITRNGTTFTATKRDGTTFTFTQQDNNTWTALKGATASAAGTAGYAPAPPSDGYNTKYLRADGTWVVPPDTNTNTTYSAGAGLALSGTTFSNSGVRSISTGGSNGTISVNTNGTAADVAVKGLGSNAYTSTTFAPLNSPGLTGTPTAPTAADGTNNTQIATTQFVMNAFKANDAMIFKGTIGTGGTVTALPATHYQGWTYRVITAGSYAGKNCEIGDMLICVTDGTAANNDHWTVVQTNIDGAVTGPASATDNRIAVFNGTSGKVIKDSGYTTGSFAAASHTHSYLPLSGGTLTGKVTFNKVSNAIAYTGTQATYDMIKFKDNTGDTYGNGIVIGGGGLVVIGGGESADTVAAQESAGNEILDLTSDGNVNVYTNLQSGWDSRKSFTFSTDGSFNAPGTIKQNGTAVSLNGHTHNYAGSSSAGGAATTALACTGNAATATKATQDESGNNIKASYASSFSISDHTITLKNKNGGSLGTVTVPDNDTKNTAGSTDTSSKIFLIGATSQAANPQTYSDNEVYATSGTLRSTKFNVADHVTQQYNTTTEALDFIFS